MKKLSWVCLFLSAVIFSGCGPELLVGAAVGGAGVFAASKDTIMGDTDKTYDEVWDSAMLVSKYRGTIGKSDMEKGLIEVSEGKSKVWIKLDHLTQSSTKLKVSSRKYKFPNLELAQQYYTKILEQAREEDYR